MLYKERCFGGTEMRSGGSAPPGATLGYGASIPDRATRVDQEALSRMMNRVAKL
jgi:hypothetical protein